MKRYYILLIFVLIYFLSFSIEFHITWEFDVGKRTFHIERYKNYAVVCDYSGQLEVFDTVSLKRILIIKKPKVERPMAGYYIDGKVYVIDNVDKTFKIFSYKGNLISKIELPGPPINMKFYNNRFFLVTLKPFYFLVLNKYGRILKKVMLPVRSPFIRIVNNNVYVPIFNNLGDNFKKGERVTLKVWYDFNRDKFVESIRDIEYPIDLIEYENKIYLVEYYNGHLFEFTSSGFKEVTKMGLYTTNLEKFSNYIVGNSIYGGIHLFDPIRRKKKVILENVAFTDIAVTKDYLFAISHIEDRMYVIDKNLKIIQKIDLEDYPIDIEVVNDKKILVLCTDGRKLIVIEGF